MHRPPTLPGAWATSYTTLYRYDGQMPIQEVRSGPGGIVVIDSALRALVVEDS